MLSARRTAPTLTATIVLAISAGCGTAETGPGPVLDTGPPGSEISDEVAAALGPEVTVRFDITGAVTVKGTTTTHAPSGGPDYLESCAQYAKGTAEKQYLAPGELDGPVGEHDIALDMRIADYTGPGSYPEDQIVAAGSRPSIAIDSSVYSVWTDSTSEAATDGKGGGTWTFTKLANRREGSRPGDAISGTVSWTCAKR